MSEINYAFNNLYATDLPWTAEDYVIADTLSDYWVNFISTGNPSGGNLTSWPANSNGTAQVMVLGDSWGVEDVASSDAKINFVEEFFSNFAAW